MIIPARNEEANIARDVRWVGTQPGVRQIRVVDDQSEDRTGEVLQGLKAEIAGLRILRVESLPAGGEDPTPWRQRGQARWSRVRLEETNSDFFEYQGGCAGTLT